MKQVYQNYEQVPWNRRNNFNSLLVLVGAFLFPPALWLVIFNLITGNVYYNRKGDDGNLKTWSTANKVVAIIFLIIQALFILFLWWLLKQEVKQTELILVDKTAAWQTYRNEEYGFEIKYPGNLIEESPALDFKGVVFMHPDRKDFGISVLYYEDINRVSWSFGARQPRTLKDYANDPMFQEVTEINFAGVKGYTAVFANPVISLSETVILLENNGHIYEIRYDNRSDNLYRKVIPTFRFLE